MRDLQLTDVVATSGVVAAEHFGGNAIYRRNTEDGTPTADFVEATTALDMPVLRYPAGEPDIAYADGLLIDGGLPDHLTSFLDAARASGQRVVIVTPTHAAYDGPADFESFVQLLMYDYGDLVHAFEIGNEYWNHQSETDYGQVANESVIAIDAALDLANADVPIWVQMGDAGGRASEYHISQNTSGWTWRNIEANNTIIEQLSDDARSAIDGVVEHYYFRSTSQYLGAEVGNDQLIGLDYQIWQNALGDDLSLNITEWNIRTSNLDQLGMRAASTLVAQFSYLIELGVDEAYVWPPQHNTSSDLAGSGAVLRDAQTGLVINSIGGATFDLMSSSLVGLERMASAVTEDSSEIMHTVYASDERVVVYLSSRSNAVENLSFSLGDFWTGAVLTSAIQVGYDQSSSDGRHYDYRANGWAESDYVIVDGEEYYINEHDVRADITVLETFSTFGSDDFDITLNPYEIIELTYEIAVQVNLVYGDDGVDRVSGTSGKDSFETRGGDDVIQSGSGTDTIYAGEGDDYVNAGSDADLVFAGAGADVLRGYGGADALYGEEGADHIEGWFGNDRLSGGAGNDIILGGGDNDTIIDGQGADSLDGGTGDDVFELSSDTRFETGFAAWNVSSDFQVGTGALVDIAGRLQYQGVLRGGEGFDRLVLSDEADAFFLHDSYSGFHDGLELTEDSMGQGSVARALGIEAINAGAGGDVIDMTSPDYSLADLQMQLSGGGGDDVIWGSDADDEIDGGTGDDILFGGAGQNTLTGGAGADTFQFTASSFDTSVQDFNLSEGDRLEIFESEGFEFSHWERQGNRFTLQFDQGQINVFWDTAPDQTLSLSDALLIV